jgi:hypothetical protein
MTFSGPLPLIERLKTYFIVKSKVIAKGGGLTYGKLKKAKGGGYRGRGA